MAQRNSDDAAMDTAAGKKSAPIPILVGWDLRGDLLDRIASVDPRVRLLNREIATLPGATHLWPPFPDELVPLLPETEILLTLRMPPGAPDSTPRLTWIHSQAAGVDYFAMSPRLADSGVVVTTSSGVHAGPLSETVIGAIIALAKDFPGAMRRQARHDWTRYTPMDVAGSTVGIIGAGNIGAMVAERCKALGMRVWGIRRTVDATAASQPPAPFDRLLPPDALQVLLGQSDYVVLTAPRTPETVGMLGERQFAQMKPGARFINVSRGDLIVEPDLIRALESGQVGGAYLDVFEREPLPADSPLWDMSNVLITAHSGAGSPGRDDRVVELFCENLRRHLSGKALLNVYDRERGY